MDSNLGRQLPDAPEGARFVLIRVGGILGYFTDLKTAKVEQALRGGALYELRH